jgi:phenylacetate-CoA ligase
MFVHPGQVQDAVRRHAPTVGRARLVVGGSAGRDEMRLLCEVEGDHAGLAEALADTVRGLTGLRAEVELVAPGSLPNDGKVIDDQRARP